LCSLASGGIAADTSTDLAQHLVDVSGLPRGLCVVAPCGDGSLAVELARTGRFLVHALDPSAEHVAETAQAADAADLDIREIIVEVSGPGDLPHASDVVDLMLVVNAPQDTLSAEAVREMLRVTRPRGKVIVGCTAAHRETPSARALRRLLGGAGVGEVKVVKDEYGVWGVITTPIPEGEDAWSHWEHGPDNNPVSTDAVIRAPYMTQWLGTPYYVAMPAITTAAGGRIFTAMGHIAHHEREEPWLNTILARNGYNGMPLWQRKLPDGYLVHRSAFVATDDAFYMIAAEGDACAVLDPDTGEEKNRIRIPETPGQWKWMALDNGVLYVLIGEKPDPAETTVVRSEYTHWSWQELSKGYYEARVPWGLGSTITAYDLAEGKCQWLHREATAVDSRAMAVGGGKVFFYCPDARVGCLDQRTGDLVWSNEDAEMRALIDQPGRGLSSTPGFRSACFCVYSPEVLFYEAQTCMNIVALSTDDGRMLWHRRKTSSNPNVMFVDGHAVVGIGPDGNTLVLDPLTGETIQDLGFAKRSCARLTATPDSFFCRGRIEGMTRYDRAAGRVYFNEAMRPPCNDGVIGANGLLYIGPWLCDCNLQLMGTFALCSAGDFSFEQTLGPDRLERAAPADYVVAAYPLDEADWPTYRGSNARGAATAADVPPRLDGIWTYHPARAFRPTSATAAGDLMFLAGDDGRVRALDAVKGSEAWTFQTAGPIVQPPTIWEGRAYVGSGDGYVYALEAVTGRLLWRFRAAPSDRRTMIYDALCSTWPINSGILLHEGVAYAAAGVVDYDGTYVYALDAETGDVRWHNDASGHLDTAQRKGVSAQGNLTVANGRLWMPAGNTVSPASYDVATGAYCGQMPRGDGAPTANRGEEIGVFGERFLVFGGRLRYSAVENVVNPGFFQGADAAHPAAVPPPALCSGKTVPAWDDAGMVMVPKRWACPEYFAADTVAAYLAQTAPKGSPSRMWLAAALKGRDVVSLALTPDLVLAVCEMPVERSLKSRWALCSLDRRNGALLGECDLGGPALPGGLIVDRGGRVIVICQDGSVVCLGGAKSIEARVDRLVALAGRGEAARKEAVDALLKMLGETHIPEMRSLLLACLTNIDVDPTARASQAGCVTHWHVMAPVPWDEDHATDAALVGEPDVDPAAPCMVGGTPLEWSEHVTIDANGMVDLAQMYGPLEGVAAYAYAEVELRDGGARLLKIGSNDGFKCWLNGVEVGRFDGGRAYAPDQDELPVTVKAGTNAILLKITQEGANWAFSARLTGPDGQPVDLKR